MPLETHPSAGALPDAANAPSPSGVAGSSAPTAREETPFLCRREVRITIYMLLATFVLLMLGWRYLPGLLDPTFEKHIQEKRVVAGMTKDQVLKAWGGPYTINVSHTDEGIRREEWIYEDWKDASTVSHRYLYFEEGILVGGWFSK
jgi:hypothetical protein